MSKYGFIPSLPDPNDYRLGSVQKEVKNPLRDWTAFAPVIEYQRGKYLDTYGCVTFSALNCLEILFKQEYKFEINFSDRFTVVMSETVPGWGNSFKRVAHSIRHDGLLIEEYYPWDRDSNESYYQPIPDYYRDYKYPATPLKERAKLVADNYDIAYEWVGFNGVTRDQLRDGLQYGPLQVSVKAWGRPNENGVYDYRDANTNHAVTLLRVNDDDSCVILDHYDAIVKTLSKNFYIGDAMLFSLQLKKKLSPWYFATLYMVKYGKLPPMREWMNYNKTGILPFIT